MDELITPYTQDELDQKLESLNIDVAKLSHLQADFVNLNDLSHLATRAKEIRTRTRVSLYEKAIACRPLNAVEYVKIALDSDISKKEIYRLLDPYHFSQCIKSNIFHDTDISDFMKYSQHSLTPLFFAPEHPPKFPFKLDLVLKKYGINQIYENLAQNNFQLLRKTRENDFADDIAIAIMKGDSDSELSRAIESNENWDRAVLPNPPFLRCRQAENQPISYLGLAMLLDKPQAVRFLMINNGNWTPADTNAAFASGNPEYLRFAEEHVQEIQHVFPHLISSFHNDILLTYLDVKDNALENLSDSGVLPAAIKANNLETIQLFFDHKLEIFQINGAELHDLVRGCVFDECLESMKLLFDHYASVNGSDDNQWMHLHYALFYHLDNSARYLLLRGCSRNSCNRRKMLPIDFVEYKSPLWIEMVKFGFYPRKPVGGQ